MYFDVYLIKLFNDFFETKPTPHSSLGFLPEKRFKPSANKLLISISGNYINHEIIEVFHAKNTIF
jgi:hypothetical protein